MTADQTIKGKIVEILKAYATHDKQEQLGEIMEKHIRTSRQEFFDADSLYHKNVKSRRTNKEPMSIEITDDFAGEAEGYLLRQIKNSYPSSRVRAFVDGLFADGRVQIDSGSIPLNCEADFVLLILAVIRRNEQGMSYTIEIKDERIENNGYYIPDMTIYKTGAT